MKPEETGESPQPLSRREFIKTSAATAAALASTGLTGAYAAGSDTIRVGLVGCGGRGTGAAGDCISSSPNVELVAMGDLFQDRLERLPRDNMKQARRQVRGDRRAPASSASTPTRR